jgi:hypothetical protein
MPPSRFRGVNWACSGVHSITFTTLSSVRGTPSYSKQIASLGFPFSFGIFQEYYSAHEPFSREAAGIAAVGTTATVPPSPVTILPRLTFMEGIMYMDGVILFPIYKRWPHSRTNSAYIGLPIISISLVAASFSNSVWHLTLTQGILYGIGGSLLYYPTLLFLDEWFVQRKGFAFGIMWARSAAPRLFLGAIVSNSLCDRPGQAPQA